MAGDGQNLENTKSVQRGGLRKGEKKKNPRDKMQTKSIASKKKKGKNKSPRALMFGCSIQCCWSQNHEAKMLVSFQEQTSRNGFAIASFKKSKINQKENLKLKGNELSLKKKG